MSDSRRVESSAPIIQLRASIAAGKKRAQTYIGLMGDTVIGYLSILPQGKPERDIRAIRMVAQMNVDGFGGYINIECTAEWSTRSKLKVDPLPS